MGVEKIISFRDWANDHPLDRLPGDRLDAQLDNHANAITALESRIDRLLRADGKLNHDLLTIDSFPKDLYATLAGQILAEARKERDMAAVILAEV